MFDHSTPWSVSTLEVMRLGSSNGHIVEGCGWLNEFQEYMVAVGAPTHIGGLISVGLDTKSTLIATGLAQIISRKYMRDLFTREVCLDFMRIATTDCTGGWLLSYCIHNIPEEIEALLSPLPDYVRAEMDASPFWNTAPDDL